jgi:DNA-binding Lrp family transcriptional regulator
LRKTGETPEGLDEKDRLLLSILQEDSELSLSSIGEQLGLTKMSVSNRIKRLKEAGILEGSHYIVNPQRVGQDYLLVSQATCEAPGPVQEKVASQIAKIPGVQSVYLTFGPYDILFIARAHDRQTAKNLMYNVTRIHGIRNTLTTIPHTVIKESLEVNLET